jgi:hypothetical protein
VAEEHSGQRLHLNVSDGVALHLGEMSHLLLDEGDVVEHLLRQGADDLADLLGAEPETLGDPMVELLRIVAYGRLAPVANVGDHCPDRRLHVLLCGVDEGLRGRGLEIVQHERSLR